MSARDEAMKVSLEEAIYREIGARDFYGKIADTIRNSEGKELFSRLSTDEEGHREKLAGWYSKLFSEDFETDEGKLRDSEIKGFEVSERTGAMEALDIAIEAESKASDFYSKRAGEATDPGLRDLFLELSEVEKGHYDLLEAERNSLSGGFYWFDMDSSSFMEE